LSFYETGIIITALAILSTSIDALGENIRIDFEKVDNEVINWTALLNVCKGGV
jgi:hypothetical protein